jgi:hypothetical protein
MLTRAPLYVKADVQLSLSRKACKSSSDKSGLSPANGSNQTLGTRQAMSQKGRVRPRGDRGPYGKNAQIAVIAGGAGQRVISVPLLLFPADRGKRRLRQEPGVPGIVYECVGLGGS